MKNLLLLVALFSAPFLFAQNPNWHVFHGPLKIFDIAFDGDEAWIATPPLGVVRMDKNTGAWESLSSLNAPISNNVVSQLEIDAQGRVWMAGWEYEKPSGLMVYDHGFWQAILQLPDGTLIKQPQISKDCTGRIWLKSNTWEVHSIENLVWTKRSGEFDNQVPLSYCDTASGIERWWGKDTFLMRKDVNGTNTFVLPDTFRETNSPGSDPILLTAYKISPLARFSNGKVLLRVYYSGEWDFETIWFDRCLTFDGQHWSLFNAPPFVEYLPTDAALGPDGKLYAERSSQIYRIDGDSATLLNLPGFSTFDNNPKLHQVDQEGNFWVSKLYSTGQWLWKFSNVGGVSYPLFSNTPTNAPISILSGGKLRSNTKGDIWHYAEGSMTKISQQGWEAFQVNELGVPPPPTQSKIVKDIFLDWNGDPWLALTPSIYGLELFTPVRWDGTQWQECEHDFRSIAFDPNGTSYWYTDYNFQLHRRDGAFDEVFDHTNVPILPIKGLKELAFDSEGSLWALGADGASIYQLTTASEWLKIAAPFGVSQFAHLRTGKEGGDVWVNNYWEIWHYDGDDWIMLDSNWTISNNALYVCLTPDQDASAWIGYEGLIHWNGLTAVQIDIIDAKGPYNYADDIAIDTFGNKWLATYYGLAVYNENGLQIDPYLTPTHEPPTTPAADFLSPNPFSETTQVNLKKLGFVPQRLSVFNAQGNLVLVQSVLNQEIVQINRNGLPSGLYLVLVEGKNEWATGKLLAR